MNDQNWRNKLENAIQKNLLTVLVGFLSFGVIAACVVFLSYYRIFGGGFSDSQSIWGQFGDFVGGTLNPIFALLSFIALLMTLLIQNKELVISSEELKKSTEALNQQSKALDLQNFERTFFELIRLHHELVNGIVTHGHRMTRDDPFQQITFEGRECLVEFCRDLKQRYDAQKNVEDPQERIMCAYKDFIRGAQGQLGHYFRNLYHIFKFVDESELKNKKWYASIMRAQLSSYELWLLFYNAQISENSRFKILIEKYAVLENMDLNGLLDKELHVPLYADSAYGDQLETQANATE